MSIGKFPGTSLHRNLLKGIVQYYKDDPRIEAVVLFGSLGRGDWDEDSDIDLDVVTAGYVVIDVSEELKNLCDYLMTRGERFAGERFAGEKVAGEKVPGEKADSEKAAWAKAALIIPTGQDEGDVVFESLLMLSVRYHPLETTKPAILDGLQILTGKLKQAEIVAAGLSNRQEERKPLRPLLDQILRYVAVTDVAIRRQNNWLAVEILHRVRSLCMELFTHARNGQRSFYFFEENAGADLQERLGKTLPQYQVASLRQALDQFINMLENDLDRLTSGEVALNETDKQILRGVRSNQASATETKTESSG